MNVIHRFQYLLYIWARAAKERKEHENKLELLKKFFYVGQNVGFRTIGMLYGEEFISIGKGTTFGSEVYLTAWNFKPKNAPPHAQGLARPKIIIGENCEFGAYNHITASNRIQIGDNCLTGKWVTITDNSHGDTDYSSLQIAPKIRPVISKGTVKIGKNVWIGDKATILPNVHIGDGVVVAANAVVTKDIPDYCVVAGNPAKILKENCK